MLKNKIILLFVFIFTLLITGCAKVNSSTPISKSVENISFKFNVPEGWEINETNDDFKYKLTNKENNSTVYISTINKSSSTIGEKLNELKDFHINDGYLCRETVEKNIFGTSFIGTSFKSNTPNNKSNIHLYVGEKDDIIFALKFDTEHDLDINSLLNFFDSENLL